MAEYSIIRHPFFLLGLSYASIGFCIIYVPPKLPFRLTAFGIITFFIYMAIKAADLSLLSTDNQLLFGNIMFAVLLYANYYLCLIKLSPPFQMTKYNQLRWIVGVAFNPRGIGKSWQIRNIPRFSRTNESFHPSRRAFICKRFLLFLLFSVMLEVYDAIHLLIHLRQDDFTHEKVHFFCRLTDVTIREIIVRLWLPFVTYLPMYLEYSSLHCLVSIIAVTLFGDDTSQWPPLYGDLRDAYSLRRFWGYVKGSIAL